MRMRLATLCVVSLAISLTVESALAEQEGTQEPLDIGSRLELFVDDYLIESVDGVRLKLHEPRSAGKVLTFDKPWEGTTSAYATVFKDGDHYRMYYRGSSDPEYTATSLLEEGEVVHEIHPAVTCLAESRDGTVWTRPNLGLYEFNGSRENNIVLTGSSGCCFAPFKDSTTRRLLPVSATRPWRPVMPGASRSSWALSLPMANVGSQLARIMQEI